MLNITKQRSTRHARHRHLRVRRPQKPVLELPTPVPAAGDALIRVRAFGIAETC